MVMDVPWVISSAYGSWSSEQSGYAVPKGTINATFITTCSDLSTQVGELLPGQSFYFIISYNYVTVVNNQIITVSDIFQSRLIKSG